MNLIDKKYFLMAVSGSETKEISPTDIAVKCPVCGDSKTHRNEKRLHIYEKNHDTRVGCFNGDCPVGQRNVYSFLRDFYPSLFTAYKREKFQENIQNFKAFSNNLNPLNTSSVKNDEPVDVFAGIKSRPESSKDLKKVRTVKTVNLVTQDFGQYFTDIEKSPSALKYVQGRGYSYNPNDFGKWYYANLEMSIGERKYFLKDFLVIPLYDCNNKMYGFYSRSLNDKKFYTYMNSANVGYKVWNYFNINPDETCYVTEGIFDAISLYVSGFKNVIASMGAKISDEVLHSLKDPVFCLDNDKTGKCNALEYAKRGYKILVYPDLEQKDLNEMLLSDVNIHSLISENVFSGIMAQIKLRNKL